MHQSISVDPSHLNGSTMSPGVLGTEKVEATVKAVPSQPSNLVTAVNTYTESKPLDPPAVVTPAVAQPNHQNLLLHQKQGNQPLLTSHRTVHQSHDLSKQPPRNPQSVINTTQTASIGVTKVEPQASISSIPTVTVGSTAVSSPKELDLPSCDSSEKKSVSKLSSSITNSSGSDPVPDMAKDLGISDHGDKAVTERQQEQLRQSPPLVQRTPQLSEQLLVQNQKHIPSEQQKQQPYLKTLELEAIHEKSTHRPPDTKVE